MNDNVISLTSRKTLTEEKAEQDKEKADSIGFHMQELGKISALVAAGRLEGLVILGRDPTTGMFLADIHAPADGISPESAMIYIGYLEMLKLEMAEIAALAPVMMSDGSRLDPFEEGEEEIEP